MPTRLPVIRILLIVGMGALTEPAFSQIYQNPLEWAALAEGNDAVNKKISSEVEGQTKTAVLQNTIAAEFEKIKEWERKYRDYTQAASGYASSLKAASRIYDDTLRIFITLGDMKQACRQNPQGIFASATMNNLYLETASELVTVFNLLKHAVAEGGPQNMLTGAERSETLWAINDKLENLGRKIHQLNLSIRYYNLSDVWHNATAGMVECSTGSIASQARERWRRAGKAVEKPGGRHGYADDRPRLDRFGIGKDG